jgi:hypothetical protein
MHACCGSLWVPLLAMNLKLVVVLLGGVLTHVVEMAVRSRLENHVEAYTSARPKKATSTHEPHHFRPLEI